MIRDWFVSMRTIIILLCLAPVAALLLADGQKAILISQLLSMWALLVGFPIDWWRLQRRKRLTERTTR